MVAPALKFLALVASSSIFTSVEALPRHYTQNDPEVLVLPLPATLSLRGSGIDIETRSHHRHHHHHHHHHGGHGTKVYADDPLIISGNGNHVHAHLHRRHRKHHGHHKHHQTTVHAHDPLIVSGNKNHVHAHLHRRAGSDRRNLVSGRSVRRLGERGLLDPLVPLLGGIPGVAGVIGLVNTLSHAVLSDTLADLIMSPAPNAMSAQSSDGDHLPSYTIHASKSSSTTMYLVAQNATASVGPSEQIVLITMPMFNAADQSVKMYCASYDPNSAAALALSSHPCAYNPNAGLDINSTSTHFSQLFSWNVETGVLSPLWQRSPDADSMIATESRPDDAGGYIIGGSFPNSFSAQQSGSSGKVAMVFRMTSGANNTTTAPLASGAETSPAAPSLDDSSVGPESQTDASSGDYDVYPTTGDSSDDGPSPEDVQVFADESSSESVSPTSTLAVQGAAMVTSTITMVVAPTDVASTASASVSTVSS